MTNDLTHRTARTFDVNDVFTFNSGQFNHGINTVRLNGTGEAFVYNDGSITSGGGYIAFNDNALETDPRRGCDYPAPTGPC